MEDHSNRPKYLWEDFTDVTWDKEKYPFSLSPIEQVIHFYEQLFFEDALHEVGYKIDEIDQVIIEDANMRQLIGGPITK